MRFTKFFLTLVALSACGETTETPPTTDIEIIGEYDNGFGGVETVTKSLWGTQTIEKFDNAKNFAITKNPADDKYFPSKFSKQVWTELSGDSLHYCTVDFNKDTLEKAETTTQSADLTKLDKGCGGFPWTKLTRKAAK